MRSFAPSAVIVICLFMATHLSAEVVSWQPCPNSNPEEPVACTVHEVRVNPCREAASRRACRIKKGRHASISFDYTPDFSGDNLESRAYWTNVMSVDLPLVGMETDACNSTTCPATAGSRQTYNYDLQIGQNFPSRSYDVKWKLWNAENATCCFIFQIKLYR